MQCCCSNSQPGMQHAMQMSSSFSACIMRRAGRTANVTTQRLLMNQALFQSTHQPAAAASRNPQQMELNHVLPDRLLSPLRMRRSSRHVRLPRPILQLVCSSACMCLFTHCTLQGPACLAAPHMVVREGPILAATCLFFTTIHACVISSAGVHPHGG
jgi:hypothetical protein